MEEIDRKVNISDELHKISYEPDPNYVPTKKALMFAQFVKEISNGGEENKTPIIHLKMLDLAFNPNYKRKAFMCSRGLGKTSLMAEIGLLYGACFNELFGLEDINVAMYIGNSIDKGVKDLRRNIESRYIRSEFLQQMIPNQKFKWTATDSKSKHPMPLSDNDLDDIHNAGVNITDTRLEFTNIKKNPFVVRCFGISTGVRGFKEYSIRPSLCHKKGTLVQTDIGEHLVEDYYKKGNTRFEKGVRVKLYGLPFEEEVTREHRYMSLLLETRKEKKYLGNNLKKSLTHYEWKEQEWCEAQNLCVNKLIGNQRYLQHYLVKEIDMSVIDVQPIPVFKSNITKRNEKGQVVEHKPYETLEVQKYMEKDEFWWLYGLWLADGHRSDNRIHFSIAYTQKYTVGKKLEEYCKKIGFKISYIVDGSGCYIVTISNAPLSRFLQSYKRGNSIKDMPEWVLKLDLNKQKNILLGYISGDGFVDYKQDQIRINSINLKVLLQLGIICERLGLPYHIRKTKKAGVEKFPNGKECLVKEQHELRLRDNVKEVLNYDIKDNPEIKKQVFIKDGFLYRKVKSVEFSNTEQEFIPIQTPSHQYNTYFGISHNCIIDDVMKDLDASSDILMNRIEEVIYKAVTQALHPTKRMQIWIGTPFNSKDPLYKAIESGAWKYILAPICEKFPCSKEEFRGAWEDRFPYEVIKEEYDALVMQGQKQAFTQEMMLEITPEEDLLVPKGSLIEISNRIWNATDKNSFNYYITTDFAFTDKQSSDYSVISVFAVNSNQDKILVDGICKKQSMRKNIDDLFMLVQKYKPLQVGIEVTGQQIGFIEMIRQESWTKKIYFNIQEIRPTKDKFSRFALFSPQFLAKKIQVIEYMLKNEYGREFLDELYKATNSGFKSKHDDVLDTFSMLNDLEIFYPTEDVSSYKTYDNITETGDFRIEVEAPTRINNTIF